MLKRLVDEVEAAVASLDPATLHPHDAVQLLADATRLRNLASAACTILAERAASSGQWRREGARTEGEWLAQRLGTTESDAIDALKTARALNELPDTAQALRAGALSPQQVAAVADAAKVDPACEVRLLRLAARESLRSLRKERERVKAAADPDADARFDRIHRERYLRTWTDADGAGRGSWSTTPDRQAVILAALRRVQDEVFDNARRRGEREPSDAYAVDALAAVASASVGSSYASRRRFLPPKAIVRVDHGALTRGHTTNGEVCEIAGVGPLPVSVIRDLIDGGDVFLAALVTKGVDVTNVVHLGRRPNALQQTALQWRDVECCIEGCPRPPTEWDHHDDWARTHQTRLPSLGGMCDHHHARKTNKGYRLAPSEIPGKWRLTAPDDPDPPSRGP